MAKSFFFSFFLIAILSFNVFASPADLEDSDLESEYGLGSRQPVRGTESNNYYEDEADEYIDDDPEGELIPSKGFDFVVESEEEEEGEDGDASRSYQFARASFLQSYFLFPNTQESRVFLLGEENELLVGITNNYHKNVNISVIRLSIMHPLEPSFYYLQNCTVQPYYQILGVKQTQTFRYRFVPDVMLQPRDYVVVVNVYFEVNDENKLYVYQAVNFTHDFEDAPSKLDTETAFIGLSLISFFVGTIYFVYSFFAGGKKTRAPADRSVSSFQQGVVQKEWISHLEKPVSKKSKRLTNSS